MNLLKREITTSKAWATLAVTLLFFSVSVCDDRDTGEPCDNLPSDSCAVDSCLTDSCQIDTCTTDSCDSTSNCPDGLPGQWEFLGLSGETVQSIAVHPVKEGILFVGTQYNFSEGIQSKLFRTRNCGVSWDTLLIGGTGFTDIDVDPTNPSVVYAVPHEIAKSTDGGNTWFSASQGIFLDAETRVLEMVIDPTNTSVLYAGTGGFFGGDMYKSTDAGQNWFSVASTIELKLSNSALAIDPANDIIYVGNNNGSILKSSDAGTTWDTTVIRNWGHIIHDIFIDDSLRLFFASGGLGFRMSPDQGLTWRELNEGLAGPFSSVKIGMRGTTRELIAVTYSEPDQWKIYSRAGLISSWTKLGIETINRSYYYADFEFSVDNTLIYFGPYGLFRYRFP